MSLPPGSGICYPDGTTDPLDFIPKQPIIIKCHKFGNADCPTEGDYYCEKVSDTSAMSH
jgi:hypothetical protein